MIKYDVPLGLENDNNLHRLIKKIKPNTVVLEFGPSTGRLTKYMSSELNCDVYGVEIDSDAYELCKEYLKDGVCGNLETYEWEKQFEGIKFDYVIFADVLEHLQNPKKAIMEVKKFLKKDAEILVSVPNIAHNSILIELLEGRFDYTPTGLLDNTHIHFFTKDTCREMFEECGYHLAYSDGTTAEPYNTEIGNSFKNLSDSAKFYLASRPFGNLYQIIYSFKQSPCEYVDNLSKCEQREYFCKIYFDCGQNFQEHNHLNKKLDLNIKSKNQTITLEENEIPVGCKRIAIEPIDQYPFKCKNLEVRSANKSYPVIVNNMVSDNESYYFSYMGKWLVEIDQIEAITITMDVSLIDSFDLYRKYEEGYRYCNDLLKQMQLDYKRKLILQKTKNLKIVSDYKTKSIVGDFNKSYVNKLYRLLKKIDGASPLINIDLLNIHGENQTLTHKRCLVTEYEGFIYCSKSDYVLLRFQNAVIKANYLDDVIQTLEKGYADVIFCDCEDQHGNECFKSDYSYEFLMHQIQEYDVLFVNAQVYNVVSETFNLENISTSYEFMLLLTQITENIAHIKKITYQISLAAQTYTSELKKLIKENFELKYGMAFEDLEVKNEYQLESHFSYSKMKPKVSIIIPTKDKWELTNACVTSILEKSTYDNYEILILNNNSEEEETFDWFADIQKNEQVRVIDAIFEFNWSKLNNYGMDHSDADVFIFLNNDTLIITPNWIEKICDDALRPDCGVVGALLLYEDEKIQHSGVVIGLNDFADHIYKEEEIDYCNPIFVSPLSKRNVMAVTGACMAISKNTINKIGGFNDTFIICGSDVEICIRAYKAGLKNIYNPDIRLYHLESKSRDSYIPPIDFEMSIKHYAPYREEGDPYFNPNLSQKHTTPRKR